MGNVYAYEQSWKVITFIEKEKIKTEESFINARINDLTALKVKYKNNNAIIVLNESDYSTQLKK